MGIASIAKRDLRGDVGETLSVNFVDSSPKGRAKGDAILECDCCVLIGTCRAIVFAVPEWYRREQVLALRMDAEEDKRVFTSGEYAFYDLIGLKEAAVPDSVTHIGKSAFDALGGLTLIAGNDSCAK